MAFTYDTAGRTAWSTSDPVTLAYTCGASAKLLVVTLSYAYNASGRTGGAPTYNSVALTQADQRRQHTSSPEVSVELWYMLNPPTGSSYTISVPNSGTLSLEVVASSYNAASGYCAMLHSATGGNNASTNPSVTITPTLNDCVIVAVVGDGDNGFAPTARSGTSLYENNNGSTFGSGHQYFIQTTAAAKAMSWTESTSDDWGCCVAAFIEVRQGVNVSKATGYGVLSQPKGVSASKVVVYSVEQDQVQVAQVAEEIAWTITDAEVQVAAQLSEILISGEDETPEVQVAATVFEVLVGSESESVAAISVEVMLASTPDAQVAQDAVEVMLAPTPAAQVAQVVYEVMLAETSQIQTAQSAFEVLVQSSDSQIQSAQSAFEVLVQGTPDVQVAQSAFEVLFIETNPLSVAQAATEVLIASTDADIQVAQAATEILVATTDADIQIAQAAVEVLIKPSADIGQVAQVATEVVMAYVPEGAFVAQVATEIVALNPPRTIISQVAIETVLENQNRAKVVHVAIEVISENIWRAQVAQVAVEVIASMGNTARVYTVATEIVRQNKNWVFTAQVATEVPMPGPAGAPGDTLITQMKLSVLQQGGGIVHISQVTGGPVLRADEDLMISQVVRACIVRKRRDFWPTLIRLLGRSSKKT